MGFRIVLADDHVMIRKGIKKILEGTADLEVVGEAGDGLELLELLNAVIPDMVILDISMPNLRGIEALREIREKCPKVRSLILSMHREYLHQALSAGADGYLLKEDADRELFSAIETVRNSGIYISPRLTGELTGDEEWCLRRGYIKPSTGPLTVREKEVLKLIGAGKSNREIAETLSISIRTVESHRANIMHKLNLKTTSDIIKFAVQEGYA
jgi:DNA-binding NarL/FixJ family response regulator